MARVTLRDPENDAVEVELDGRVFTVATMTRSRLKLVDAAEQELHAAATTDEVAAAIIKIIDTLVLPSGGQKKTAASVLTPLWEGDKLALPTLTQFLEDLQAASEERPT